MTFICLLLSLAPTQANRLVSHFGYGLTEEKCQVRSACYSSPRCSSPSGGVLRGQGCRKLVFPSSVAKADKYMESEDHKKRPMYIYCGHWFHYHCLDAFITKPPFGKSCPVRAVRNVTARLPLMTCTRTCAGVFKGRPRREPGASPSVDIRHQEIGKGVFVAASAEA